jgi:ankyrin repeat protein
LVSSILQVESLPKYKPQGYSIGFRQRQNKLHFTARYGLLYLLKGLLMGKQGDNIGVDSKDSLHRTPLWWAAKNGHEGVVKLLLDADADSKDFYERTPLWQAAKYGHEAIVKLLLDTGKVDADSKDFVGETPLSRAAENGHEAVVKLLMETGKVDVDSKDTRYGQTPLLRAAKNRHDAVVKLLQASRAPPDPLLPVR